MGEIVGSEALVRWRHPQRGMVMPGEFIAVAEETGQIVELGHWILDSACGQWRAWADLGHTSHQMSVNVSARQLQEPDFADHVASALDRHRMIPDRLVVEITESIFALDGERIFAQLAAVRALGVRLAVDDFGTGYSSLSYLKHFEIDEIKVDKAFVDDLGQGDSDNSTLAKAIVSMAQSLRLDVVAEGIEEPAQRHELWSMGCRLGQGYLYSRPVPADELLRLLSSNEPLGNGTAASDVPARPVVTEPRAHLSPASAAAS